MALELSPALPSHVRGVVGLIADTADATFVVSLDCQFLAWSNRAQTLFGYSSREVLGRYCYDVLAGRDASGQCICSVNCPMVTAARCGYCAPPSDQEVYAKGRRPIWVRVSPIVLRAPHGTACAVLVLATDVGRYKLAEQITGLLNRRLRGDDTANAPASRDGAALLRGSFPELTAREADVLWEAITGEDYHRIATALDIRPTTARNHLQRVLQKLGVHSQRQAVLKALLRMLNSASARERA